MNRYGRPGKLAETVIWLASQKASFYVTSSAILVDGVLPLCLPDYPRI